MANLIITIISIALVAVIALAGIYYGSAAYSTYQVRAKATEIISKMRQIKAAALLWQTDHPGQSYPTIDPTGVVASCDADSNSVYECWSNVLPYNNQYLNGITSEEAFTGLSGNARGNSGGFAAGISYGNYGIHRGDVDNGFPSAFIKIQNMPATWPTANPVWYVRWFIALTGYVTEHPSGSPSQTEAQLFAASLCHEINRQMGYEKSDGTYPSLPQDITGATITINNSILAGTSTVLGLPYSANNTANLCVMQQNGTTLNQLSFLLPL